MTGHPLKAGRDIDVVQSFQIICKGVPYPADTKLDIFHLCENKPDRPDPMLLASWVAMPVEGSPTVQVGILLRGKYFSR